MSQSIAASLQKEAEEWVASTLDQLLLYLSTIDQCLISKEQYSHLRHLGGGLKDATGACDEKLESTRLPEQRSIYSSLNIGRGCLRHFRLVTAAPFYKRNHRAWKHEIMEL